MSDSSCIQGRKVLVTGVSRRAGIGAGVVRRLVAEGHDVFAGTFDWVPSDFERPDEPARIVEVAAERLGGVECIVAAHARSSSADLASVTAEELDRCWAVNSRASVLLAQSLGRVFGPPREHGRLVLFTSGQHIGPMGDEIAYAVSKGAIHQMTASLADQLAERGITVNCVNPGPVDTEWVPDELRQPVARMFPAGRWGTPDDIAKIVSWLCSPDSAWLTGQVLDAEGGFRRWAPLAPDS